MKTFILIYLDKGGNELTRKEITAFNIEEARKLRNCFLADSMLNDLFKIRVIKKDKPELNYKAYIAGSRESKAFDHAYGTTAKSAIATVKRRNSPDWKDCYVWAVYLYGDGTERRVHINSDGSEYLI